MLLTLSFASVISFPRLASLGADMLDSPMDFSRGAPFLGGPLTIIESPD